jgi:hypothetical protein
LAGEPHFGGVAKRLFREECRRWAPPPRGFGHELRGDVRHAFRLMRLPSGLRGHNVIVIVALGIAASRPPRSGVVERNLSSPPLPFSTARSGVQHQLVQVPGPGAARRAAPSTSTGDFEADSTIIRC